MPTPPLRARLLTIVLRATLAGALVGDGAASVLAADLYHGKTLILIAGYAPGGGVDATARVIARHLARFIPGHPHVVVQNMEGGAGLLAGPYVARRGAAR